MNKKLNCVLLIDDDYPTNFFHKIVINEADCTRKILAFQSAIEALEYLKTNEENPDLLPDLIFLDINMPAMNGWEFLTEYGKLKISNSPRVILVMLTTSINPEERKSADQIKEISGFISKPLSKEIMEDVVRKYFIDWDNENKRSGEEDAGRTSSMSA